LGVIMIAVTVPIKAQFYDLDPMGIVWHGNYVRYLEQARCVLLDKIGYGYTEMGLSGYSWPVVDMRIKYVASVHFLQEFFVHTWLDEYKNRLKIKYQIKDADDRVLTRAYTVQVAVDISKNELRLESPDILIQKVEALLGE